MTAGKIFETTFDKFLRRNKRQCNNCGRKKLSQSCSLTFNQVKEFIETNSNCKLLSKKYENAHEKLLLKCECGNEFAAPFKHFKSSNQRQCSVCGREKQSNKRRLDYNFVKDYIENSGNGCKLLSKSYKNNKTKLEIQCHCGNKFETLFSLYRNYDVRECYICRQNRNLTSKGELKIEKWLNENKIKYKTQVRFKECKNKNKLPFDFGIYNSKGELKLLIEYDGKQHYGLGNFSSDLEEMEKNYEYVKINDQIKNEFCFNYGIPLLRIPYNKYSKIEEILKNTLQGDTEVN